MPKRLALALALALALIAAPAGAECVTPAEAAGADVLVGLRLAPPFVVDDPIRGRRGLTYDLWASIERELVREGLIGRTAFIECSLGAQIEALAAGRLDLVISPLTITAERLERFDFTHQYLGSGLTVAQRSGGAVDFRFAADILRQTLARDGVPRAILIFLAANLVLGALLARELRRSEAFAAVASEPLALRLCRYGLETVVRTIGLRGLDDGFRSTAARLVEVFIAIVGTLLSAMVFGLLTSALVGSMATSREVTLEDLAAQRVATLADSTGEAFLGQLAGERGPGCAPAGEAPPGRCTAAASWREAMSLLVAGEVDLVLGDWAQLAYLSRLPELAGRIDVQSRTFRLEPYGWGISRRRPELRAAIDRALLARVRSTEWRFVVEEYMGGGSISPE